jgi:mannose-1-phosphate guanylyltransferase
MTLTEKRVAVIMAGGSGERFWPLSRRAYPKQLLPLCNPDQSLLEQAVERVTPLIPPEDIYIQTSEELVEAIREARIGVPPENVIAEPMRRNTAGCLAYAAAYLLHRYHQHDVAMAILTADHDIGNAECFRDTIARTLDLVCERNALGTIGMLPTRPATGFGYIQAEEHALDTARPAAYGVRAFHEKPNQSTAEAYVRDKRYFWNGGMFFWKISAFLDELELACPPLAQATRSMADAMGKSDAAAVRQAFSEIKSESIDYALMEKAKNVVVVEATFPWDDIGSWAALERTRTADADGNVVEGAPVLVECRNSIVYDGTAPGSMAVGVIGMEGVVVVVRDDAVLVMPKDRAEDVKRVVEALKTRGSEVL